MVKPTKRIIHPDVLNTFHVQLFQRTLSISTRRITCLECENIIRRGHFAGVFKCKYCRYKTHCEEAAKFHCKPAEEQECNGTWAYIKPESLGRHGRLLPRPCPSLEFPDTREEIFSDDEGHQSEQPVLEENRTMFFDQLMEIAHDEESNGEQSAEVQRILEQESTPSPP